MIKSNYGTIIPSTPDEKSGYDSSDDDTEAEMNRRRSGYSLSPALSTRLPSAASFYDKIPDFTLQDEKELSVEQKEDIHKVMLSDMYSWTTFVHMGSLDQEILWLMEMSKVVAPKHPLEFIKKHMSWSLKAFIENFKIDSISQLMRLYSRRTNMSTISEFHLKRPFARRKIVQLYCRQVDFESNFLTYSTFTKRRKMEIETSTRNYLLHNENNLLHNVNDTCYLVIIDPDVKTNKKYSKIPCRVLGYKRAGSDTLYYNVELDDIKTKTLTMDLDTNTSPKENTSAKEENNQELDHISYILIERVHPQSLFTSEQYEKMIVNS
jgi:hypothetical protein